MACKVCFYKDPEGDVRPSSVPNTAAVKKVLASFSESLVHALKDTHDILRKVIPSTVFEDES